MKICAYDFCENKVANTDFCSEQCSKFDAILRDFVDDDPIVREPKESHNPRPAIPLSVS